LPSISVYNSIALETEIQRKGTTIAMKLCNSIDLPKSEIDRGPQHVDKAKYETIVLGNYARKSRYGLFTIFSGALQNSFRIANIISIALNENVSTIIAEITQNKEYGPKTKITTRESIMGFPKGSNSYGNGVLILGYKRGSHLIPKVRQCSYSTSALAVKGNTFDGRDLLSKMKVQGEKYTGLYNLIKSEELLFGAYQAIKSKPGNMTPGNDKETLDGFSPRIISNMTEELETEKFKFSPSRRE